MNREGMGAVKAGAKGFVDESVCRSGLLGEDPDSPLKDVAISPRHGRMLAAGDVTTCGAEVGHRTCECQALLGSQPDPQGKAIQCPDGHAVEGCSSL